jgi:hypothetical protein
MENRNPMEEIGIYCGNDPQQVREYAGMLKNRIAKKFHPDGNPEGEKAFKKYFDPCKRLAGASDEEIRAWSDEMYVPASAEPLHQASPDEAGERIMGLTYAMRGESDPIRGEGFTYGSKGKVIPRFVNGNITDLTDDGIHGIASSGVYKNPMRRAA